MKEVKVGLIGLGFMVQLISVFTKIFPMSALLLWQMSILSNLQVMSAKLSAISAAETIQSRWI